MFPLQFSHNRTIPLNWDVFRQSYMYFSLTGSIVLHDVLVLVHFWNFAAEPLCV